MNRTEHGRVGVVFNPSKIEEGDLRAAVDSVDAAVAAEARWYPTTVEDPGRGQAREALEAGCELVLVAGGDGTVRAVAEVLAGTDVPLGIVPQGTGNLLARNLDVPLGSVEKAVRRALEADTRSIDLGWVALDDEEDERGFAVMVGFGLDAKMLAETDDDLKSKAGWLAYVESLGRAVSSCEVVDLEYRLDDGAAQRAQAHTVLVGNCGTVQGGVALMPNAAPDDGQLDMLLVSSEGAAGWLDTLRSYVWDNGVRRLFAADDQVVDSDTASHVTASSVAVTLPAPQTFEIDGEEIGEVRTFRVRLDAGALRVR